MRHPDRAEHPDLAIGLDVGGTRVKAVGIDRMGSVLSSAVVTVPRSVDGLVAHVVATVNGLCLRFGPATSLGIALPGLVDPGFGARSLPGKLPGLEGFALVDAIQRAIEIPVTCLNDGAAATYGEWRYGAGMGLSDIVVLTLGTGVGSGVVVNGRLFTNANLGSGGGLGHLTIDAEGPRCPCGNRGCAETRISATAMINALWDHVSRGVPSVLAETVLTGPGEARFENLVAAATTGDLLATELLERFIRDLGTTIVSAVHAFNPAAVVIVGGMTVEAAAFLPQVQAYVSAHAWRYPRDRDIPVVVGALADLAGAIGVAAYAREMDPPPQTMTRPGRLDPAEIEAPSAQRGGMTGDLIAATAGAARDVLRSCSTSYGWRLRA